MQQNHQCLDVYTPKVWLLGNILRELGLEENIPKACPPSVIQTVLGVVIDTENMTISVTSDHLTEIAELLEKWKNKKMCRKKELQSLIGKLLEVYCVQSTGKLVP